MPRSARARSSVRSIRAFSLRWTNRPRNSTNRDVNQTAPGLWRTLLASRRGASALEFAVVGALAVTLMFGVMEAARYQFTQQALRSVAGEAARIAMLRGSANMAARRPPCEGLSGALAATTFSAPFLDNALLSVQLSDCATQGAMTLVTVTVTQPFAFVMLLIRPESFELTETTRSFFN